MKLGRAMREFSEDVVDAWRDLGLSWHRLVGVLIVIVVVAVVGASCMVFLEGMMDHAAADNRTSQRQQALQDARRCEQVGGFPILSASGLRLERCER